MLYSGFCRLVSENPVVETQPYFFQVLEVQGIYNIYIEIYTSNASIFILHFMETR